MNRSIAARLGSTIAAVAIAGCLFHNADAPRFYRPASAALAASSERDAEHVEHQVAVTGAPIRLHAVRSAPFLRERVVWRASPVEYGLYEQRRWFELPSRYVRRALTNTLEVTPGLHLADDTKAARLDVEILAFDEVLAPTHQANVELAVTLREGTEQRLDRVYAAQAPIASADAADMAAAMGQALDEVVQQVAHGAAKALAPPPSPPHGRRSK
jgi:ABC-type uncharacterized transport system auxiliary subunit